MNKQSETVEQVANRAWDKTSGDFENPQILIEFAAALLSDPAVLELVPGVKELREENERLTSDLINTGNKYDALAYRIASLETQNRRYSELLVFANERETSHREKIGELKREIVRRGDRIASLEQQLAEGGEAVYSEAAHRETLTLLARCVEAHKGNYDHNHTEFWDSVEEHVASYLEGFKVDARLVIDEPASDESFGLSRPQAQPSIGVAEWHGALLAAPWKLHGEHDDLIRGEWAEDGLQYFIECPKQLAPLLIEAQNKAMLSAAPVSQEVGK